MDRFSSGEAFPARGQTLRHTRVGRTVDSNYGWQDFDDKPRWSPDGRTIYHVSDRDGVFNVRGIHFDSAGGKPRGESFPVTAFDSPGPTVPRQDQDVELSLTQDKLLLTMEEVSGSIWLLDNVDP